MKRFVQEYANYKLADYKSNALMLDKYKIAKSNDIKKALRLLDQGFITIDECIRIINES